MSDTGRTLLILAIILVVFIAGWVSGAESTPRQLPKEERDGS